MDFKTGTAKKCLFTFALAIVAAVMALPAAAGSGLPATADSSGTDLIIQDISLSPAEPGIGASVAIMVTVKNQGAVPAAMNSASCYVDDVLVGTEQIESIPAGDTAIKMFTWTAQAGSHTIRATADATDSVVESDETNNTKNYTFTTLAPDLVLTSLTWQPTAPSRNDNVVFTIVVKNLGNYNSTDTNVILYINGESKGIKDVVSLNPNGSTTITYSWAAPAGSHTVRAVVDEADVVKENDENNNEMVSSIGTAAPDLSVPTITYTPEVPSTNDLVTFTITVLNQGSGRSDRCFLAYFFDEQYQDVKEVKPLDSGESTTFTVQMTATSKSRMLSVKVDYYNDVVESNENNNENSSSFKSSLCDLVVKDMTWSPNNAGIGDDVTFTATIKNEGVGKAEASRGAFVISGKYWGYVDIIALGSGETTTTSFTWTAEYAELSAAFTVDFDNKLTEVNEFNNYIDKVVPIVLPDLFVSGITWTPINPSLGDIVTFTVTVVNQHLGKAGSFQLGFYNDDELLASETVDSMVSQETITRTFTWEAQNGRHTFRAMADASKCVTESDESNNEYSVVVVPYMPDLIVGTVTWSPLEMLPGSEVTFNVEIQNIGSMAAGLSRVTCLVDNEITGYFDIEKMEVGEVVKVRFPWAATTGCHELKIIADSSNQVIEIDEGNNTKMVNLPPPDLIVQDVSWLPENASIGDNITVIAMVFNQGLSNSQEAQLSFYIDGVFKESAALPQIPPSESKIVEFTWMAQSGTHTFRMDADSTSRVTETDETNNDIEVEFTTLTPDITVTGISWWIENATVDENATIEVILNNTGSDKTGAFHLGYIVDNKPSKTVDVESLPAGGNATISFPVLLEIGTHDIYVTADVEKEVIELDESNNQASINFTTVVPDLVVKTITINPAESAPGQEVTVTVSIENRGREAAQNVGVDLAVNGTSLGSGTIGEIIVGAIVPIDFKWTALEGVQEFQAGVDAGGAVVESNDKNNTKTRSVTVTPPIVPTTTQKVAASVPEPSGGLLGTWWWIILLLGLILGGAFFYTTFKAIRKSQK